MARIVAVCRSKKRVSKIGAVSRSERRGTKKIKVFQGGILKENYGLGGLAKAGDAIRVLEAER